LVRERKYLLILVLATVFLIVFNLPASVSRPLRAVCREGIASYQGIVTRFMDRMHRFGTAVGERTSVVAERDRLVEEVAGLRGEVRRLEGLARANDELRDLLGFARSTGFPVVPCEVIAREDAYGWWQTIRLDRGNSSGIRENMAVITPAGLVGRTMDVSADSCDVLLVSDRNCKVSVRFDRTGSFGILRGGGITRRGVHQLDLLCNVAPYAVDYVPKDIALKTGDVVVTSGLGGTYPPDIPVGTVRRAFPDETGLYQHAEVVPLADLARLRHVLVVVGRPAGGDGRADQLEKQNP
jgi:rod shape-determining protein MreC